MGSPERARWRESFSIFSNSKKKPDLKDFPEKRAPHKVKYFQPICQILRNFTEGKAREVAVRFAFCAQLTS